MGRHVTTLGVLLLLAATALYLRPIVFPNRPDDPAADLYLPPRPGLPRVIPPLDRALLPRDEHEAAAALDLAARGEIAAAREKIGNVLERFGETGPRLAVLGLVELSAGDPAASREAFERALKRRDRSPIALLGRARLRLATRRFEGARRDLEMLTAARPGHPESFRLLAVACLGTGDADAAFAAAEEAVELAPGSRAVLRTMGSCLIRLGREPEAAEWLAAADSGLTDPR